MRTLGSLIRRNCQLFFKDKGMFFTSLITPLILLILYATFLSKVYKDSFAAALPPMFTMEESIINGMVGAQLVSSLLAVCCVTVAFCSNLLMVQDKISGARRDLTVSPVKASTIALAYFMASALATLLVCGTALCACLIYLSVVGWYFTVTDILLLLSDTVLLVLFGTALSSLINAPLSTNGQGSAVGTIVSAGYGFLCGAYMPISNFGDVLQKVLSFLPGTYGTSLLRNHALRGVLEEMRGQGVPDAVIEGIRDSVDCNLYFFGHHVSISVMYLVLVGAVVLLTGAFVLFCVCGKKHRRKER